MVNVVVLLSWLELLSLLLTLATFVKSPLEAAGTLTRMVTAELPPLAIPPRYYVTILVPEQLGKADTRLIPDGKVSVTTTLLALDGPALLTVKV